ncbi:hypothetical protein DDT91_00105 [Algoriphagus sp. AK58]|nr:hypothetical protein [Algoriphagus sp. AK58]
MIKFIFSVSVLILLGFFSGTEAQIMKKIQNAAAQGTQNALNKKAGQEAEKATSNQLDKMFAGIGGEPADTQSEYQFTGYMVMEVTTIDKKGKKDEPVKINYLLSPSGEYTGMWFQDEKNPDTQTSTILDFKNQASIILMNDGKQKSSLAIKMDSKSIQKWTEEEMENQMENKEYELVKTGNSKTILGYECEEYLVNSEEGTGQYWVTKEPIEGYSLFSPQSNPLVSQNTMDKYASFFSKAPKGSFLEMIFTEKDGSKSEMKVIEMQKNKPQKFVMADYPNLMSGDQN